MAVLAPKAGKEHFVERMTQHPFTLTLGLLISFFQAGIYVAEGLNLPFGRLMALEYGSFHAGGVLFVLSHYAPISGAAVGAGFSAPDFLASLLLFLLCGVTLLACGPLVESYLGTRRMALAFVLCTVLHALFALALQDPWAYSSLAFCVFLSVTSLLIHLERRDFFREGDHDFRALLLVLALAFAGIAEGFMPHPSYGTLLVAVAVGPVAAFAGFVMHRRYQRRVVAKRGEGSVGSMYFVEEVDILTQEEIQARMDRLLEKISQDGMQSLSNDERRFLSNASGRLRASQQRETSP